MGQIYFTSDLHFGHGNVIRYSNRPYANADEMDEALVANWNSVVGKEDSVYLLGDVTFRNKTKTLVLLYRLNGKIFLIRGNHDNDVLKAECAQRFEWIKDLYLLKVPDEDAPRKFQPIVLCHYPLRTWNLMGHGAFMLHGHCHGTLTPDPNSRIMDVGVDCTDYKPISYDDVKKFMAKKRFIPVDHHKEEM